MTAADEIRAVCMSELGCFNITADFDDSQIRPINLLPDGRDRIDTQFLFYSRARPKRAITVRWNETSLMTSFESRLPTVFIVHGFLDNIEIGVWMSQLKDDILGYGDYNVVLVDWRGGNGLPYASAAANSRVVGAEIALLIHKLEV